LAVLRLGRNTVILRGSRYFFEKHDFLGRGASLGQAFEHFIALWSDLLSRLFQAGAVFEAQHYHLLVGMRALRDTVPLDAMETCLGTPQLLGFVVDLHRLIEALAE